MHLSFFPQSLLYITWIIINITFASNIPHARIDPTVEAELKLLLNEGILRADYISDLATFLSDCPAMRIPESDFSFVHRGFLYSALGKFLTFVRLTPLSSLLIHS